MSHFTHVSLSLLLFATSVTQAAPPDSTAIPRDRLQAVYDAVKTPFKYGVVIEPPPGKKIDSPQVFRQGSKWYMVYVQFEQKPADGYTTQLAESDDLLHWKPLGTLLDRGPKEAWDHANAGGYIALFDTKWGGTNTVGTYRNLYWLSYLGGRTFGYEGMPLSVGLASSPDPVSLSGWKKEPAPVLSPGDADARPGETATLYKSFVFHDDNRTLGAPFVMFYNAKPTGGSEQIFVAVSDNMLQWRRYGSGPVLENLPPPNARRSVISGDAQIVRMGDVWVMFYFGAFWKPGAFNTFAVSRDLVHWTKWDGPDLVSRSEPYDARYAHKTWIIQHEGVVYHFYCAVDNNDHRTIALATSVIKTR